MTAAFSSLADAIAAHVHDGDEVALEGFTHLIPFAAAHEIIRQERRDLTLIRMTPDIAYCFDDQEVQDAVLAMERYQIRRLPILTRDKRLVGMVSLGDLAVSSDTPTQAGETLKHVAAPPESRR